MDNNLHKDNLESFFHKELHPFEADPGDAIWDAIEAEIPAPPPSRILPLFSLRTLGIAASFLVLVGVSLLYWKSNKALNEATATIKNQQILLAELSEQSRQSNNHIVTLTDDIIEKLEGPTENKKTTKVPTLESKASTRVVAVTTKKDNVSTSFAWQQNAREEQTAPVNYPSTNNERSISSAIIKQEKMNVVNNSRKEAFAKVEALNLAFLESEEMINWSELKEKSSVYPKSNGTTIGVFAGLGKVKHEVKPNKNRNPFSRPQMENHPEAPVFNNQQAVVLLRKEILPNLFVRSGVGISEATSTMEHTFNLEHDPNRENPGQNGYYVSNHDYPFASSMGSTSAEVLISRAEDIEMASNEPIEVQITSKQEIKSVSIPLGVDYNFPLTEQLKLRAIAGIEANIITDFNWETMNMFIDKEGMEVEGRSPKMRAERMNSLVWNAEIGAGLSFEMTPNISIDLESMLSQNISPIHNDSFLATTSQSFDINAGLTYHF